MPWRITFSLLMVGILIGGGSLVIAAPPQQKPGKPTPPPKAKPSPPPSLPQNPLPSLLQTGPLLPVPLPKPPVPARSMLYGVNVVWGMNGSDTGWEVGDSAKAKRLVALMKAAGVTNTRVGIGWGDVERERGKLDWRGPDKRLRFVKSQGFVITGVVASIPDWANDPDPAVRALFADRGRAGRYAAMAPSSRFYADFGRFAFQLGKRYKDIVHRWEFWNEPDGWGMPSVVRDPGGRPIDIATGGDPALYARLLKIFSENIKRADPTCLVAVGGLSVPRTDFLQALYANGGQKAFDAVGLHPSSGPRPLAFDWIDACHQVLLAHGDGRKKLWLTEWGWNTYPGEPDGIVEGQQAKLVRASFAGMRERNFIDQASLHTLNDWRAQEDDPLSLRSTGLCARDLIPKPAYYAFQSEARGLNPLPAAKPRRVPLVANWEDTADAPAHLDLYTNRVLGALPKIGRGIVPEGEGIGGLPAQWEEIAARLKPSGTTLVCLAPFQAAGMVTLAADGTPSVQWERADTALSAVAQAGAETILELMPPPNMPPSAWSVFVAQAARRYGSDPKFGVARWELAATAQQARIWYEPFARTVRAALPTTPLGLFLTGGDPAAETKTAADLLVERSLPCDSLAWRAAGGLTEETQTFRRLRSVLAGYPALKSVTLWPRPVAPGSDAASAARCVAQAARWADFGPLDQPNALGGVVSALPETASGEETSAVLWNALTALNRVSGTRLRAESDDSGLRGLAARAPDGRLSILMWREGEAQSGELRALLRLHGLTGAARGGLRMEQFLIDAAHSSGATAEREEAAGKPEAAPPPDRLERAAWTDLPANAGDIELPLVFAPDAVMLLELRPHRPPPVQITLSAPRFTYMSGEELPLIVNLRNGTKTPQRAVIQLQSSQAELVPPPLARTALGALAPGASRVLRFRLPVPVVARDALAFLNVSVGSESRCALAVRLASSLVATLDTPRIDLSAPGAAGTARVRLVNRAKTRLSVTLRASGSRAGSAPSEESVEVPGGGKPVAREVEIAAPARDPGNYPVEITVRDTGGVLAALTATVGVPVLCRYAAQMPIIDGDLREWADADPMGMGRREQVGEKEWRGPADLSAVAYAKWDDRFFYFACAVTDDAPFQPFPAAELQRGDSVVFALSSDRSAPPDRSGYGPGDHEIALALLNLTQPVLYRFAGPPGVASGPIPRSVVAIRREGTRLFYEAAIPWTALAPAAPRAGATYGFSVVVNDNDGQGRGYIAWGGGLVPARRPGLFPPLRLVK